MSIYAEILTLAQHSLLFFTNLMALGDDPKPPDFTPLTTLVKTWGMAIVSAVLVIFSILSIFVIIKIGFKIMKSSDEPEARANYVHSIIWWAVGFGLGGTASIVSSIFTAIFFKET